MSKAPTLIGLRECGTQSNHFETGGAGLEGEGGAVRVGQRDDIRVVALQFNQVSLSIPESIRVP